MPRIPFLIDENVPRSVADYLKQRGHEVRYVREAFPPRSPDALISVVAADIAHVVVTWDRDFKRLANRLRRLSRLSFECDETDGRRLIEEYIRQIELHYEIR